MFGTLDLGREMANRAAMFDERPGSSFLELSKIMMSYWAEFVRAGDPGRGSSGELLAWPEWSCGKFIVLDSSDAGGLRLSDERVTRRSVIEQINANPRFANRALKSQLIDDLRAYFLTRLVADDYTALGASSVEVDAPKMITTSVPGGI